MKSSLVFLFFARIALVVAAAFSICGATASSDPIDSVTMAEDGIPIRRWSYGQDELPKGADVVARLASIKKAQFDGDAEACAKGVRDVRPLAKSLQGWLSVVELDCYVRGSNLRESGAKALELVEKNPSWLLRGAQAVRLRQMTVKAYLALLEQDFAAKGANRARGWRSVAKLQELASDMDERSRAQLWRFSGELAQGEQRLEAARDFFRRSLAEFETEEARSRLNVVNATLVSTPDQRANQQKKSGMPLVTGGDASSRVPMPSAGAAVPDPAIASTVEASPEETALVDRVTAALKAGDLVGAMSDAVKIVREYPGGVRAKWAAERIYESFLSVVDRNDPKYALIREQMSRHIELVDADRLSEWARSLYSRGHYEDSLRFARKSLESMTGARTTKVLELAGKAAIASDKFEAAREIFNTLMNQHAGTPSAREALLRSGLLHYRLGDPARAITAFERVIAVPQSESGELIARYWLWRALQKTKSPRADLAADELMRRFPFSYYGLRARIERSGGVLEWKNDPPKKLESRLWLTEHERLAWEKAQLFLKAGWFDEAQSELRELPPAFQAEDKAVRALVWAAAAQYATASKLANEAWDEKSELRRFPFVRAMFPTDFQTLVRSQAESRKLNRYLIHGLIKQESSYDSRAISGANAYGLMQVLGPTAREMATELKLGALQIPEDLFVPRKNIQVGTYYLSRMIAKYQGTVPLALAAYNAGPGRMDKWLRSRPSLKSLPGSRSSAPEDELWFDEIPYDETSFYVKAILRNVLLYRVLDQGRVVVSNPLWVFE